MKIIKPKVFILDVDGVMTTGHFIYTKDGKSMKIFGPMIMMVYLYLKTLLKFDL